MLEHVLIFQRARGKLRGPRLMFPMRAAQLSSFCGPRSVPLGAALFNAACAYAAVGIGVASLCRPPHGPVDRKDQHAAFSEALQAVHQRRAARFVEPQPDKRIALKGPRPRRWRLHRDRRRLTRPNRSDSLIQALLSCTCGHVALVARDQAAAARGQAAPLDSRLGQWSLLLNYRPEQISATYGAHELSAGTICRKSSSRHVIEQQAQYVRENRRGFVDLRQGGIATPPATTTAPARATSTSTRIMASNTCFPTAASKSSSAARPPPGA